MTSHGHDLLRLSYAPLILSGKFTVCIQCCWDNPSALSTCRSAFRAISRCGDRLMVRITWNKDIRILCIFWDDGGEPEKTHVNTGRDTVNSTHKALEIKPRTLLLWGKRHCWTTRPPTAEVLVMFTNCDWVCFGSNLFLSLVIPSAPPNCSCKLSICTWRSHVQFWAVTKWSRMDSHRNTLLLFGSSESSTGPK